MNEETAALIEMLRGTRRPQMREMAVRQLAERRDPDAAEALLSVLDTANESRIVPVVTAALGGLQALGESIVPLVVAILDRADPRRVFMPLLLAAASGEAAVPRLLEALYDEDIDLRINAATQLGQLRSEAAFERLLALVHDEGAGSTLRGVAASALGTLRDSRALPVLASLSRSEDPELLGGAVDELAELRDPAGTPYLEAILDRPGLDERITRAVRLGLLAMERYRDR